MTTTWGYGFRVRGLRPRPGMTAEQTTRRRVFSDSIVKQPALARTFQQTRFIVPIFWSAIARPTRVNALWGPPSSSFPHTREGAERRKALSSFWHLGRCRVPCDRHARLPALHRGVCRTSGPCFRGRTGGVSLTLSRRLSPPFIRPRPATEGSPRSRADGDPRRPGAGIANPRPQAPHLAPPT